MSAKAKETVADKSTEEVTEDSKLLDKEVERIVPDLDAPIELVDGTHVVVRPLKLTELMAAFKIVTRGAALSMGAMSYSLANGSRDQVVEHLIALLLNAIPEATPETSEFIRVVVDPVEPEEGWSGQEDAEKAERHLDRILLGNPELEDAVDIITRVVQNEASDLTRLVKKVTNAARVMGKVAPKNGNS